MEEKFLFGALLGMVVGSIVVANSNKAKQLIKQGQQKVLSGARKISSKKKSN